MFGTITPNHKSLTDQENARYQAVYCGLCHSLQQNYNAVARLCLTYDLTFLILLLSSLYEPQETTNKCNCIFHPGKSFEITQNKFSEYAADMTVLLAFNKFMDDRIDKDHKLRGQIGAAALKTSYEKAKNKHPQVCEAIEAAMKQIVELEDASSPNADEISKVFGLLLAIIFSPYDDVWKDSLARFGANLGRLIYFMDAALDLSADKKSGAYNPYLKLDHNTKKLKEELSVLAGAATAEFEKLPLLQDEKILQNILYEGLWSSFNYRFSEKIKTTVDKTSGGKLTQRIKNRRFNKIANKSMNDVDNKHDKENS